MDTTIPVDVETFSAVVAQSLSEEDVVFADMHTRCGSGMGQSVDD